jgi:hypothetical protein
MMQQISADIAAEGAVEGKTGSGKASLDIFTAGSDTYVRLRKLAAAAQDFPQLALMADMAKGPFLDKWVKFPKPEDMGARDPFSGLRDAVTKDPRKAARLVRESIKTNFPLVKTADLGFKDGDYSYEVEFSGARLAAALESAYVALSGTGAEPFPADLRSELAKVTGTGTLVVNEAHKDQGSLAITLRAQGEPALKLAVSNRPDAYSVSLAPTEGSGSFAVSFDPASKTGKLEAKGDDGKAVVTGTFSANVSRGASKISGTFNLEPGTPAESAVVKFSLDQSMKADNSVKLTPPANAVPFEQVMGGILGGVAGPSDPSFAPTDLPAGFDPADVDPATQAELEALMGKDAVVMPPVPMPKKK